MEQIRLWGAGYGEIYLHDADVSNDITVILSANASSGGQIILTDNGGSPTIDLHGGQTGNTSVELPTDAIDANEMFNEPGLANQVRSTTFFTLSSVTFYAVDSIDIQIPSAGYVEITGGCFINLWHINGVTTEDWVGISKSSASFSFSSTPGVQVASIPSVAATGLYQMPCTSTRLFAETAGTHRYYLLVRRTSGTDNNNNVAMMYLRAKFYPTAYGTIDLSKSNDLAMDESILSNGLVQYENPNIIIKTLQDANAELEAEREALRAENERLRTEKAQIRDSMQKVSQSAPNNQR